MPNAKVLEEKKAQVAVLKERLENAVAGVVVDYSGITVADDTKLRKELREAGAQYEVIKNTLIRRAIEGTAISSLYDVLSGATAIATSSDDQTAVARILSDFAEKNEKFTIKAGFLDGEVISLEKITFLAKLPSKTQLLATVCSVFQAPMAYFARAVKAIIDKEGENADVANEMTAPETEEKAADATDGGTAPEIEEKIAESVEEKTE